MSTAINTPWQGDWQERLGLGIQRCGFASLDEFLTAHPADSYLSLARLLDANIAPMQLYGEQLRRAQGSSRIRDAAADSLARFLTQYLKRGWGHGRHFQSRLASAYAAWKTSLLHFVAEKDDLAQKIDAVWAKLEIGHPPQGWRPSGRNDRVIEEAFDAGWPER